MKYLNLTNAQKRIWYMEKEYSHLPMYNIGGVVIYDEIVDFEKLQKAINIVISQNENLRLRFCEQGNQPLQYIQEYQFQHLEYVDLTESDSEYSLDDFVNAQSKHEFSVVNSCLYNFVLLKISGDRGGYFINLHHIIADGWGIYVVVEQIRKYYELLCENSIIQHKKMPSIEKALCDEEKYLNSNRFQKDSEFWIEEFKNYSNKEELCVDTVEGKRKSYILDSQLNCRVKKFLKENNFSNQVFWTFVYSIFEHIHDNHDPVFGIPVFNRHSALERQMIAEFTNILPLKSGINTEKTVINALSDFSAYFLKCLKHSKYPYNLLQQNLQSIFKKKIYIYNVCINCYEVAYPQNTIEFYNGFQPYKLQIVLQNVPDGSKKIMFDYLVSEYSELDIDEIFKRMMIIAEHLINNTNTPIKNLSFLNEEEYQNIILDYNNTFCEYPTESSIVDLFELSVEHNKNNVAAAYKNKTITYSELNAKANSLANFLISMGVGKNDVIGIMMNHSIDVLVAIWGILKTGATYLPLDMKYPVERLLFMVKDSNTRLIIAKSEETELPCEVINICNFNFFKNTEKPNFKISSDNIVYIIYTSGSTGNPKGVRITHRGLINYISWASKYYIEKNDVFALYSSLSFDLTVTSIFTPLISGNKIEVYSDDEDEYVLYRILRENKCTIVKLTPAHLSLIKDLDNRSRSIKKFIVGGENLSTETSTEIYNSFGGDIRIFNEYGPTETVVGCMIYEYSHELDSDCGYVSIGKPINNTQIYILDKNLNPVPKGVAGELYISGDGVSPGYLNRDNLNRSVFMENPFISGKRMYKSGDIGMFCGNTIHCLGRVDNQVKINGHRIELGEIEMRLKENEALNDAVVCSYNEKNGKNYLCAYIIENTAVSDDEIMKKLSFTLPRYMIPHCYVRMESFPLTANGKVDYKMLNENCIETAIKSINSVAIPNDNSYLKIISDVLNVTIDDMSKSFYEFGGDSIKAIQISGRMRENGAVLKVQDIQNSTNIIDLLNCIHIVEKNEDSSDNIGEILNTPILQWYTELPLKNMDYYCQSIFVTSHQNADTEVYKIIFDNIIHKHDMLHLQYNQNENKFFVSPDISLDLKYVSVADINQKEEYMRKCATEAREGIDIRDGHTFSVVIFADNGEDHIFMTANHTAVDGVSWRIILRDVALQLEQYNNNLKLELTGKSGKFDSWSKRISKYFVSDMELDYWKYAMNEESNDILKATIASDPDEIHNAKLEFMLNSETTELLLNSQKNPYNATVEEVLVTAILRCIAHKTGMTDISIEIENHGRGDDESNIVGWFTSMFVLRAEIDAKDVEKSILNVKKQIRDVPNQGVGYGVAMYLNKTLKKKRKYIRFNYLGDIRNVFSDTGLTLNPTYMGEDVFYGNTTDSIMDINCICSSDELSVTVVFNQNEYDTEYMRDFCNEFLRFIKDTVEYCTAKNEYYLDVNDYSVDISQEELNDLFS